ncbi:hypothetical protein HanRHA438_Chr04g0199401 [Helianthus annuus]|nr:hypothetical protein HanRHA438_Chr04g0199401 [Helianthus annuus]
MMGEVPVGYFLGRRSLSDASWGTVKTLTLGRRGMTGLPNAEGVGCLAPKKFVTPYH